MHRLEFELNVVWHHPSAQGLDFLRESYCHRRMVIPRGALLCAHVQSGQSYRCYWLLPPRGKRLDGIGMPRPAFGRPVPPWQIQPRRGTHSTITPRRIAAHVRHELQRSFGIKPSWSLRTWLRIRHFVSKSRTLFGRSMASAYATLSAWVYALARAPIRLLSRLWAALSWAISRDQTPKPT
jgi:hypothetical protein